ncbi:MAG: VWA domain-containing protein, partial [Candidatus Acidiferrales bacterium]
SLLAALIQNKPFPVPEYTPPNLSADMPSSGGAAAGGSGLNGPVISQMQQAQQAVALMSGEVGAFYARLHIDLTTNALVAIANHLRHVPGRKNLIWLSAGFPMEIADPRSPVNTSFSGKAQKAARALSDADVAIYPVDARGLIAPDLALDGISGSRKPGDALQAGGIETIPAMRFLASLTGGVAYSNSNDIASEVRNAIDDSVVSYALGFYPQDTKWDGAFHDLNVRIAKPGTGLSVRFRRGYYATPDAPLDRNLRASQIVDAISSPLDASGVGITASMEEPKISSSKIRIIHLNIDANAIHLEEKKGRWDGAFDIIFVQRTAAGKVLDPSDQTMKMHLLPATYQQVLSNGYRFTRQINLAPDAAEIHMIVRDTTSSEIGSLTIPLASESAGLR